MTSSALCYYIDECMTLWEASLSDSIHNKLAYHILQTPNHLCCLCPNLSICILERKLCDMHVWLQYIDHACPAREIHNVELTQAHHNSWGEPHIL